MAKILLALLVSTTTAFAQSPAEITKAISELGSAEFRTREAAGERLRSYGAPAVQPLQDSLAKGNPEASRRAEALIAQIRQRLSDEAAIAPKVVSLQLKRAKLGDVFDELRKQTTYEFRIHGDSTLLAKELDFDTRGKVTLWEAVQKLCAGAGLTVESVAAPQGPLNIAPMNVPKPTLTGEEAILKEFREKKILDLEVRQARLELKARKIEADMAKANARERAVLAQELAAVEAESKENSRKVAALQELLAAKANLPSPTGTITLGARGSGKPLPSASTGGIRMEIQPMTNRGAYTTEQVPLIVKFQPEPGVRWVNVVDAVVTKAVNADGRDFKHHHIGTHAGSNITSTNRNPPGMPFSDSNNYAGKTIIKPVNEYVIVLTGSPGKTDRLTNVEGIVRANVWTSPEAILTIQGLSAEDANAEEAVPDAFLSAKLVPNPANKSAPYLDVVLSYNMSRVKPRTTGAESHDPPIWLGQGVQGQAVLIKPVDGKPQREMVRNEHGLSLTDAKGNPFVLNMNSAQTTQYNGPDGMTIHFTGKFRYTFRPVGTEVIGAPVNLAFHGTRIKTISFPFALTDVPVAAGTSMR